MPSHDDYTRAAELLWGEAGAFAAAEYARLNEEMWDGELPPLPIVIGITAYSHCIGLTRPRARPRITLSSEIFNGSQRRARLGEHAGPLLVSDTLLHEMTHALLMLRGQEPDHNAHPWCAEITRISKLLELGNVVAEPVTPRRVPNPDHEHDPSAPPTIVKRLARPGALPRAVLARWPMTLRPAGYYPPGQEIPTDTY